MIAIAAVALLCLWLVVGAAVGVIVGRIITRADRVECGVRRDDERPVAGTPTARPARRPADRVLVHG